MRGAGGRSGSGRDVPPALLEQFERIAARAADAGRPLDPVPLLEVAAGARRGSRAYPGSGGDGPRVRLSQDLLDVAPAERAWTIAHELSHVLHRQEGLRPGAAPRLLVGIGVLAVASVGSALGGRQALLRGSPRRGDLLFAVAAGGAFGLWLAAVAAIRREEDAADATAAVVFGEVLGTAGVERLLALEGALARRVPTLLRDHSHPVARRRAGLAAQGSRPRMPPQAT